MRMYRIWCHERSKWWGPHEYGYTAQIESAGQYSEEDAVRICRQANTGHDYSELDQPPQESMVPVLGGDNG